jgi:uncharacterized membrane protein YeaQ/YmgE (transglycosylase-associated protein family)
MELFLGWLVFSGLAGWIASNKGRSGVGVFFLSLILSPLIGVIVALCLQPARELEAARAERGLSNTLRKCPFCAEIIKKEATKCRYCGSEIKADIPVTSTANTNVSPNPSALAAPQPPSKLAVELGRLIARLVKNWRRLSISAVVLVALFLAGKFLMEQYDEWARQKALRENQARNDAYIDSIRTKFQSSRTEILKDIQRAISENRIEDAKETLSHYGNVVNDAELQNMGTQLKVIELTKEYESIPRQREHARMNVLRLLVDADPGNPQWRRELAALEKSWGLPASR